MWREKVAVRIDVRVQPQEASKKLLKAVRNSTREERSEPRHEGHDAGGNLYNEEHEKQRDGQDAPQKYGPASLSRGVQGKTHEHSRFVHAFARGETGHRGHSGERGATHGAKTLVSLRLSAAIGAVDHHQPFT